MIAIAPAQIGIPSTLDEALAYARRGWPVMALHTPGRYGCDCGKRDCDQNGKHPHWHHELLPHGLHSATTDESLIRQCWQHWPAANLGIRTGAISGLVVVDEDPRHGGEESLAALERQYGPLPTTVESVTGGPGVHHFFAHPGAGVYVPNVSGDPRVLGPGLDVRGDGGYIVAPPSLHRSGRQYLWEVTSHPDDVALAPLPPWLLERLVRRAGTQEDKPRFDTAAALNGVQEGGRDQLLFQLACKLRRADVPRDLAEHLVLEAASKCQPPFPEREALAKVANAYRRYEPAPHLSVVPDRKVPNEERVPPPPETPQTSSEPPTPDDYALTDIGNAERLLAAHGWEVKYIPLWGAWLVYDGTHWVRDVGECRIRAFARQVIRRIGEHAAAILEADPKRAGNLFKHAVKCEAAGRIAAMVDMARTFERVWATPDDLDTNPWLLNVDNGTIDLRTGTLLAHNPAHLLTQLAPVAYNPGATCPRWLQFIREITCDDVDHATYLQRAAGQSITGDQREQAVYLLYGLGSNGKSTYLNTIKSALGPYAMQAKDDLLLVKSGTSHPTELADLYRKRLVVSTEVEDGRRLAEALVKQLTGGERIRARRMREDFWEFDPTHTVWIAGNHKPEIRGTDWAIWRRIRLIPFNATFYDRAEDVPRGEPMRLKDPTLVDTLQQELPGILRWLVDGCLDWQRHGLAEPEIVRKATAQYRSEMDVLAAFLAERCHVAPQFSVFAQELYTAYTAWCEANGEKPEKQRRFGMRLRERGFANKASTAGRSRWFGLGLRDDDRLPPQGGVPRDASDPLPEAPTPGEVTHSDPSDPDSPMNGEMDFLYAREPETRVTRVTPVTPPDRDEHGDRSLPAAMGHLPPPVDDESLLPDGEPLEDTCIACGAPVDCYGPGGEPMCAAHADVLLPELGEAP